MSENTLEVKTLARASIRRVAVQNQILYFSRQLFERSVEIESMRGGRDAQSAL